MGERLDVVIIGGGGHASVLLDALRLADAVNVLGYVAPEEGLLSTMDVRWLGGDMTRSTLAARGVRHVVLGFAGAKSNRARAEAFDMWQADGFTFVDVIHPRSTIAGQVTRGAGLQIMAGAVINPGTTLGANVIVNTNATVEHHCVIGDHAHVAPGATLCGAVVVGAGALIGAGAVAAPGTRIGAYAVVGAGTAVVRDVNDGATVVGQPARLASVAKGMRS